MINGNNEVKRYNITSFMYLYKKGFIKRELYKSILEKNKNTKDKDLKSLVDLALSNIKRK